MSSEDIRYARRSDIGAVSASAERLGRLATVDWIELMVTLTVTLPNLESEIEAARRHGVVNRLIIKTISGTAQLFEASTVGLDN